MNEKKKKVIQDGLNVQDDLQEAIAFFSTHGLGIRNIMRLDRIYGKEALSMVKENPYRMVEEVDGIGFKTADKLALSMGFEYNDPRRMEAALLSLCLGECIKEGDSYLLYDELKEKSERLNALNIELNLDQKAPAVLDAEPEQSDEPPERKCENRER